MKDYKKIICLTAAVCLLGAAAFCGYHIYDHYAHEAEQTEAFEEIAAIVEQAQTEDNNAPEVPLTEEENVLAEYGELFLKNTDMVGWLSIAGTTVNYPVMQTPNEPNYYLKRNFEKKYSDLGTPYIQENCDLTVIIAAITSRVRKKKKLPTHLYLGQIEGLPANSIILFEQLRTIDKSRLKEHLTHLDEQYLKSLEFPLLISIGVEKRRSL